MKLNYIIIIFLLFVMYIIYNVNYEMFTDREKYTAIIIEPREHKALEYVLNNFLDNLSDEWSIILFHGNKNIDYINKILDKMVQSKRERITLINLKVDNLTISEYSKLFTQKSFYENIPTEIFLVFQTDTVICNKDLLDDYLDYDWVGAPWLPQESFKDDILNIGNGGLSLRRKTKMLEIIDKVDYHPKENEDLYFARGCKQVGCNIPELEKQKIFSNEHILTDDSFGVHKLYALHDQNDLAEKYKSCPQIKVVRDLQ